MEDGRPHNWLDPLRLLFASLVIFGHSFELPFGNRDREPLTLIFHTASCGEVAVAGFLILSGYLISSAWTRQPEFGPYLRNRVLRITPGFWVAFLLSVLVAGPLGAPDAGAYFRSLNWPQLAGEMASLHVPSAFFPEPVHWVNGALWTIQLEFACYLLAPLVVTRRAVLVSAWVASALLAALTPRVIHVPELTSWWFRGVLMFLSGAAYRHFSLTLRRRTAFICAVFLPVALSIEPLWEVGLATAGGYLILGLGLRPRRKYSPPDISYGVYLYGWPIQGLLVAWGLTSPPLLLLTSLSLALLAGAASWFGVERWALRLKSALHFQHGNKNGILTIRRRARAIE